MTVLKFITFALLFSISVWGIKVSSESITDEIYSHPPSIQSSNDQWKNEESRYHSRAAGSWTNYYSSKPRNCMTRAECVPLPSNYTTCFGVKIPYTSTSLGLVPNILNHLEVQKRLNKFQHALYKIPKCWADVQPFLCALYMPKCEEGQVVLPTREMCEKVQKSCRILNLTKLWQQEFNCSRFKQLKCANDISELKFNTLGYCIPPLVPTKNESIYYEGIDECTIQCRDPLLNDVEREEINNYIVLGSIMTLFFNLFAMVTLILEWESTLKFSTACGVLCVNFCFVMVSIGYLLQLFFGSSVFIFCFVYYFLIAGLNWFIITAYAWESFVGQIVQGRIFGRKDRRVPYYQIFAWCSPLILFIIVMMFGEINGNTLSVCFIGGVNDSSLPLLILAPSLFLVLIGFFLFMKGILMLYWFEKANKEHVTPERNQTFRCNITRTFLFSSFIAISFVNTFVFHIYDSLHYKGWENDFSSWVVSQVVEIINDTNSCSESHNSNFSMSRLRLMALFGTHISVTLWIFKDSTLNIWHKVMKKLLRKIIELDLMPKHKIITVAYAQKKRLDFEERLSIDIENQKDLVGLYVELNNSGSQCSNSSSHKYLPNSISRPGAVTNAHGTNSSQNGKSADSEFNISIAGLPIESHSRRNSSGSVTSMKTAKLKKKLRKKRHKMRHSEEYNYNDEANEMKVASKHSGDSSLVNNLEKEVMEVFITGRKVNTVPNMGRRFAIPHIDNSILNLLNIGRKLENCNYSEHDLEMTCKK